MKYDYFCPANQETYEVEHGMLENLATWGELCAKLDIPSGQTPLEAPVERVLSGGTLALPRRVSKEAFSDRAPQSDSCAPRPCCGPSKKCTH